MTYILVATKRSRFFGWCSLICIAVAAFYGHTNITPVPALLFSIWFLILALAQCDFVEEKK